MTRSVLIRLAATFVLLALAPAQPAGAAGEALRLKPTVMVKDAIITVGDLFEGAGAKAGVWLADAPDPGQRMTLLPSYIGKILYQQGLTWRNRKQVRRIVVTRTGKPVALEDIKRSLLGALRDQGARGKLAVRLANSRLALFVATNEDPTPRVHSLDYDRQSGRFVAELSIAGNAPLRLTGRVEEMLRVPVLRASIGADEVITREDIDWIDMPARRIGRTVILSSAKLVGMTPRHLLRTGTPVRLGDVHPPILIRKGTLVTMIVSSPAMSLTATGRALENGARDQVIRVINTSSHTTVEGVVDGPGKVRILSQIRLSAIASDNQ
jgi:flagella basal body P-ring formation protein FlgA